MLRHGRGIVERLSKGAGVAKDLSERQGKLWEAADQLRSNSGVKASEYASPVLGLIFLRYADERFTRVAETIGSSSAHRPTMPDNYKAVGVLCLPRNPGSTRCWICPRVQTSAKRSTMPWTALMSTTPTCKAPCRWTTPASPLTSPGSYCAQRHRQSRVRQRQFRIRCLRHCTSEWSRDAENG